MKRNMELLGLSVVVGFFMVIPLYLGGCDSIMYPTVADVQTLAKEEIEHRTGLQEATVTTMTDQHGAMTPELEAVFATMLATNRETAAALTKLASEKVATVKGPEIGSLGGALGGGIIPSLLSMFGLGSLIPIYNMFFGKSRAAGELDALKLELAKKAGANETIPG